MSNYLALNAATSSIQSTASDDFFSAFLGNQKSTTIEANEVVTKSTENGTSLRTWNTYSDNNNASSLVELFYSSFANLNIFLYNMCRSRWSPYH